MALLPSAASLRGTTHDIPSRVSWKDGGRACTPLTVYLTDEEIFLAMTHAVVRYTNRIRAHSKTVNGQEPSLDDHAVGAMAELAVAKALNKFFPAGFRKTDVGEYEVRATRRRNGELVVRQNDSSAKRYLLVICETPKFHIVGWIWGSEAKDPKYWKAPNGRPGAYFVPQSALYPLDINCAQAS